MPRLRTAAVVALAVGLTAACGSLRPGAAPPYETGASTRAASSAAPGVTGRSTAPGGLIDLADWYLTLPTGDAGHPDTVEQPQLATFSNGFFQLDPARDGIVFTADAGGVTTANSTYPRSELREMDGTRKAAWSNRSGVHTMALRQAVTALPAAKPEVVTAQIHDAKSDVVEVRLEGERLIAQYDDGRKDITLDPAYVLGTPYDLRIVASNGKIEIFYDGRDAAGITQSGDGWYFKTGSYLQSNTTKGDAPDAIGQVVLYSLQVTHSS